MKNIKEFEEELLKHLLYKGSITKEQRILLVKQKITKKISILDNIIKNAVVEESEVLEFLAATFNATVAKKDEEIKASNDIKADMIYENYGVVITDIDALNTVAYFNKPVFEPQWEKIEDISGVQVHRTVIDFMRYEKIIAELEDAITFRKSSSLSTNEQLKMLSTDTVSIKFVDEVLHKCIMVNASDIHIEPQKKNFRIRMRLNGVLCVFGEYDLDLFAPFTSRIKLISKLDIAEKRDTQDGALLFESEIDGKKWEVPFRISVMPTIYGEKIVLRKLGNQDVDIRLDDLGMSLNVLPFWRKISKKPHGIILVSGPTGSGKSTTLHATINEIKSNELNITTVEDPVEAKITGVNQVQIDSYKVSFADALRSILRQDPDIIMLGEIRDQETAEVALRASLTGHLVFSTIHTNDAASSVTRLVDMGIEPFLVSSSVIGVLAQRLVRTLCSECKKQTFADEAQQQILKISPDAKIYEAVGCRKCNNTGYVSRVGVYELLVVDTHIQKLVHQQKDHMMIKEYAVEQLDMPTIFSEGRDKVLQGVTSIEEFIKINME